MDGVFGNSLFVILCLPAVEQSHRTMYTVNWPTDQAPQPSFHSREDGNIQVYLPLLQPYRYLGCMIPKPTAFGR